jgi:hypothetical protein
MRAREHEREPAVGDRVALVCHGFEFITDTPHVFV